MSSETTSNTRAEFTRLSQALEADETFLRQQMERLGKLQAQAKEATSECAWQVQVLEIQQESLHDWRIKLSELRAKHKRLLQLLKEAGEAVAEESSDE